MSPYERSALAFEIYRYCDAFGLSSAAEDAGYCLDAPGRMPAGSMVGLVFSHSCGRETVAVSTIFTRSEA